MHFRSLWQFYSVNKHTRPSGTPSEALKFASTRLTHVSPGCCHQACALASTGRYCLYHTDRNHIHSVCSTSPVSFYILRLPPYILLRAGLSDTSPVLECPHYSLIIISKESDNTFGKFNYAHRFSKLRKATSLCANVHVENYRSGGPSRSSSYGLMNHILILRPQVPKSAENGLILRNSLGSLQAMDRRA